MVKNLYGFDCPFGDGNDFAGGWILGLGFELGEGPESDFGVGGAAVEGVTGEDEGEDVGGVTFHGGEALRMGGRKVAVGGERWNGREAGL